MTGEEVIEANLLIAHFVMGAKCLPIGISKKEELKYYSSWDWLMPVVEKYAEAVHGGGWNNSFGYADVFTELRKYNTYHDGAVGDIQRVWYSLVEFIKRRNEELVAQGNVTTPEYRKLFKQYYDERNVNENEYIVKHNLQNTLINSIEHPLYFSFDRIWKARRLILDEPLLAKAKYKIWDNLEFIKNDTRRLSFGFVSGVKTSDAGTGEILYQFYTLSPQCSESNPYCLEKDIIRRIIWGNDEPPEKM